ncbi:hypothetical protein Enr13x_16010 [Stieleria neptunia]|uniref:Uncharacterized protein n=1 Tax=Stieleria neptunia TaxID=2527979 RepID=A0A518HLR9_9BACT|nr:hypothetical protein [Stieleria neptunia]QDV41758.1 hypothetical protein Enr13x_16010 [Stieleria neptunia]
MAQSSELSEIEAIKRVIAEGGAMDYVDVVDAVEKRFRIKTSAATVEQVHHDLVNAADAVADQAAGAGDQFSPSLGVSMAAQLPSEREQDAAADTTADHMTLAMQFVKSVGGLNRAKNALAELEAMLRR